MSRLSRDRTDFSDFVVARSPALQRAAYLMVGDVPVFSGALTYELRFFTD